MTMQPLVSVIVPNYNHFNFLKQRLESIYNQSYQNFEVILLDDASSDQSLDVLATYHNHPKTAHYLVNTVNSGSVFKQWIKGIKLARGKYIWIAESDDYADVNFLKETMGLAEQHQDVGMVFTDSFIVKGDDELLEKRSTSSKIFLDINAGDIFKIEDRSTIPKYFVSNLIIYNASSVLFHTAAIKQVDFDVLQTLKNAGDLFVYLSIALTHDIVYLHKPLNYHRMHTENTTTKSIKSGVLFKDRQTVISYFINPLSKLSESKKSLKSFFSRNFLTAIDFKFYNEVSTLLNAYYRLNIVPWHTYMNLTLYISYSRLFKKTPHRYRQYIKKILLK